jgi:flavin-dependent dehydrogenase
MAYKTEHIVVVGGGSAGWMTAATLIKAFPNKSITVVESSSIPKVGVGESTLTDINIWLDYLEVDRTDFMRFTNAAFKTSIGFTNFYTEKSETFFVPFGDPHFIQGSFGHNNWFFKKAMYPETPNSDYFKFFYPSAHLIEDNKITLTSHPDMEVYKPLRDVVYQFDAALFGQWLAEKYAMPKGVKRIIGTVAKINSNEDGITSLILEDGHEVTADLFVDCTGFRSLLLGSHLKEPFVSTKDILPNNRAWAGPIPYTDKEKELQVFTNCTALKNGWVWNTPLWSRIGSGYVYSNEFIDDETALEEFKQHLNSKDMVVYDPNRSESMEFRQVEIKNGYYERFWVKNVIAIGLSGGFLEPLESTGLYFIHAFLLMLVDALERGVVTQWDIDTWNKATRQNFETQRDFVALHFAMSLRDDSPYWKQLTMQDMRETFLSRAGEKYYDRLFHGYQFNALAAGMGFSPITDRVIKEVKWSFDIDRRYEADIIIGLQQVEITKWKNAVKSFPTHYQYLKENIYED